MIYWMLDEALEYVRELQPKTMEVGWCLLLGGGVLNRGSGPDLDLLAYPRTPTSKRTDLITILPEGTWDRVDGVSDIYCYSVDGCEVELIFQTRSS